jgi:hypothetical protein
MTVYVIAGNDPQTVIRRRLMEILRARNGWLTLIRDRGKTTAGPVTREYFDNISRPDADYRMFRPEDVSEALAAVGVQAQLPPHFGLWSMREVMGLLEEAHLGEDRVSQTA